MSDDDRYNPDRWGCAAPIAGLLAALTAVIMLIS